MILDPTTTLDLALAAHRDRVTAAVRHRVANDAGDRHRPRRNSFWTPWRPARQH